MSSNGNGDGKVTRRTKLADLPELLTPEEFGAWLGLSRNATYESLRRGDVKSVRFGRLLRVPKSALAELAK